MRVNESFANSVFRHFFLFITRFIQKIDIYTGKQGKEREDIPSTRHLFKQSNSVNLLAQQQKCIPKSEPKKAQQTIKDKTYQHRVWLPPVEFVVAPDIGPPCPACQQQRKRME
jgi:hypothetical protein